MELLSETKRRRKKKRKNEVARKELKDGALTRTDITFGPKVNIKEKVEAKQGIYIRTLKRIEKRLYVNSVQG